MIYRTFREIKSTPVEKWKQYGVTAIPKGSYPLIISLSNRFKIRMPEILNVPGFSGVRIHKGNTHLDTEGCVLVGMTWSEGSKFIGSSAIAFEKLMVKLKTCEDTIIIVN